MGVVELMDFDRIIKAACEKLVEALRAMWESIADFVKRMAAKVEEYLARLVEATVEDFIEAHYLMTEHADLVATDEYLDAWYPLRAG